MFDAHSVSSLQKIRIGVDVLPDGRVVERVQYNFDTPSSKTPRQDRGIPNVDNGTILFEDNINIGSSIALSRSLSASSRMESDTISYESIKL